MIDYRTFRNNDPPGLAQIWNLAFTGRGAITLPSCAILEDYVYAKPYFDPRGLIVALDGHLRVGFVHAGFGPDPDETRLVHDRGVVCVLGVLPSHRRRGIGSELLRRAEAYLREQGARELFAGPMRPLNPFYLGLYGGCESAGFLASDAAAEPFFTCHGYRRHWSRLVFQRTLTGPVSLADARFVGLRRRFQFAAGSRSGADTWWQECILGPIDPFELEVRDRGDGRLGARIAAWEMTGYAQRWQAPVMGLADLDVRADLRRQGLAKYLVQSLLRYFQEQFFTLVEAQARDDNPPAVSLFKAVGFQQVDVGYCYRKQD